MSVRFKYYLRGCGLGILVASLVFIVSLHAHGGAMSDEKAMQRASELGMIMPDDTQTQEAETQTTELPVKETNLPDTQRTTQAVTQKVPQNDTQKQTERDTSSDAVSLEVCVEIWRICHADRDRKHELYAKNFSCEGDGRCSFILGRTDAHWVY